MKSYCCYNVHAIRINRRSNFTQQYHPFSRKKRRHKKFAILSITKKESPRQFAIPTESTETREKYHRNISHVCQLVTCLLLRSYVDELLYWSGRRLTLEECLHGDLTPHRLPPTWISHDKFVYQADDGSLALLDTSNNSVSLLVSNHTLVRIITFVCS